MKFRPKAAVKVYSINCKKAIRLIAKMPCREHVDSLFGKYRCLKFKDTMKLEILKVVPRLEGCILRKRVQ